MGVMGTTWVRPSKTIFGATGRGAVGASGGAVGAAPRAARPSDRYTRTAFLLIRPPSPVPRTSERSTPGPRARRRTRGDDPTFPPLTHLRHDDVRRHQLTSLSHRAMGD